MEQAQLSNFGRLSALLQANPADFYVLPELCLDGYSFMSEDEAIQAAQDVDLMGTNQSFSTLDMFQNLSTNLNAPIVFGFVQRAGARLHNSQMMVFPRNQKPVTYAKLNRFGNDYLWATPGSDSPKVVDWQHTWDAGGGSGAKYFADYKIGGLICRDIRNESKKDDELYSEGEVDVLAFSANWGSGGFPSGSWVEFAEAQQCWLVVANRYGLENNNDFGAGGSCIISPSGKVHCQGLKWGADCVIIHDIPTP